MWHAILWKKQKREKKKKVIISGQLYYKAEENLRFLLHLAQE